MGKNSAKNEREKKGRALYLFMAGKKRRSVPLRLRLSYALSELGSRKKVLELIGRPALAKRLLQGKKPSDKTRTTMQLALLPFINRKETEAIARNVGLPNAKNLGNLKRIRCFSRKEIEALRAAYRKGEKPGKAVLQRLWRAKMGLIMSAIGEPELTAIACREVFAVMGINARARATVLKAVGSALGKPKKIPIPGKGIAVEVVGSGVKIKQEGRTVKLVFERKGKGWRAIKLEQEGNPKG